MTAFDSATGYAAEDAGNTAPVTTVQPEGASYTGPDLEDFTVVAPTVTDLVERMWPDETYS
jgi:hypothetical protein